MGLQAYDHTGGWRLGGCAFESGIREKAQVSKKGPWLFRVYIGDKILPSYVGIIS